ncbi:TadE/TadG family type IV pilus assembly protein [Sphingomonas sp. KC8]|uniref:TadE/TadG family type IV pilus assembly protein n=1 Tax=Sphingomonas sp. KC8 TaxID=1030157 RepID=UPI000248AB1F|nr:TadE family protein [Sphingomonas sp. KC8]ARS28813.1 hypothetical protein KC8_16165 [Sphingomonas sp. KC8]
MIRLVRRLRDDRRGAAAVEFALVSLPLVAILLGIIDFGYRMYLGSVVEGTVHRAARMATVGGVTSDQVDTYITSQLQEFSGQVGIEIEKTNYYEYSGIGRREKRTKDRAPTGVDDANDCFEDLNGNGIRDAIAGRNGLGGSDDIVYYKVTATFQRIVPLVKIFGFSPTETVTSSTVLRNQPFASQTVPLEKCPDA